MSEAKGMVMVKAKVESDESVDVTATLSLATLSEKPRMEYMEGEKEKSLAANHYPPPPNIPTSTTTSPSLM